MTLIKFRPTIARELLRDSMIPNNVLSTFDSIFNDGLGKFERNVFFTPRVDVVETEKEFNIHIVLPGLKKEEIDIALEGDVLTVSGERKQHSEKDNNKFHLQETYYGKFSRSFTLPENVDKQNVQAELIDGILKLTILKTEVKETKMAITIK